MTQPGRSNTLAAYVAGGGKLWAAGGGATLASLINFNKTQNDPPSGFGAGITFMSISPFNELIPGRFPYDAAGWQSEIKISTPQAIAFVRTLGRFESSVGPYGSLPATLQPKSSGTDPLPPLRSNPSDFYQTQFTAEYLSQPNDVQENLASTLDSLYSARGGLLVQSQNNVTMSVYRPTTGQPRIWTGFSLWNFRRADCQALVDWVLQQEWGLPHTSASLLGRANTTGAWRPQPAARR
jgi:hypothetical protein